MSAPVLFVSDLHLDHARPQTTAAFQRFLAGPARDAQALYILGDLFEAWLGDDHDSALAAAISTALRALADSGVRLYFLRGNRDFLLGPDYAARCGMRLLPDPCVVVLHGTPTLLMHGDLLCTADRDYQRFRAMVRTPQWQTQFLAQPLAARAAFVASARQASQAHQQGLSEIITDVEPAAVTQLLQRYGIERLIHGHTHRQAIHRLDLAERAGQRIVLGDWYTQGSVLRVDAEGNATLSALPLG
jgi:UDP-2,3-diacylglucosamine hydrolase